MVKIESKPEHIIESCGSCNHFKYCAVYWGAKCKRQGGNEIPRMKTNPIKAINKNESIKWDKPRKQIIEMFEPIRTKLTKW